MHVCYCSFFLLTVTRTWSQVKTFTDDCDTPTGRYAHICTLSGSTMYIQGGTALTEDLHWFKFTADVFALDLETMTWRKKTPSHDLDLRTMPVARDFHSGVYINSTIVVFGGKCEWV